MFYWTFHEQFVPSSHSLMPGCWLVALQLPTSHRVQATRPPNPRFWLAPETGDEVSKRTRCQFQAGKALADEWPGVSRPRASDLDILRGRMHASRDAPDSTTGNLGYNIGVLLFSSSRRRTTPAPASAMSCDWCYRTADDAMHQSAGRGYWGCYCHRSRQRG